MTNPLIPTDYAKRCQTVKQVEENERLKKEQTKQAEARAKAKKENPLLPA